MLVHLTNFQNSVADARGMVSNAHQKDAVGAYIWHSAARSMFVESSFMKIFISWETFLEKTFIEYMLGNASILGNNIPRYVNPIDATHANNFLIGRQQYVDWSTPDIVRRLAKLYFANGEPYESGLASIHSDLLDLKTIRNASSHMSSTTTAALDALASRKLQTTITGCTPASLLLAMDPNSVASSTFLNGYCDQLDSAANSIASA